MKKAFIISVLSLIGINSATAFDNSATAFDIPWWEQPTVCRVNETKCYVNMGDGFNTDKWDGDSNCYGMKYICPNAFNPPQPYEAQLVSRNDIKHNTNNAISDDFDTNILSKTDDCFGVRRKYNKTGSEVMVGGKPVKVWCTGILEDPIDETENGEITDKPVTCDFLEKKGYIGVENGKCWGKPYDASKYHVDCGGEGNKDFKPARLVILNGTEFSEDSKTEESQKEIMNEMYKNSKKQKAQYFQK